MPHRLHHEGRADCVSGAARRKRTVANGSNLTTTNATETKMAKGQMRSNRETRKPKKDKTAAPVAAVQGAQVKLAGGGLSLGKKPK